MCNLHDISWGNRPSASSGTNALAVDLKKQEQLKANYMVYRINFMAVWLLLNIGVAILLEAT